MEQRSIQTGVGMITDERQRQLVDKKWAIARDVREHPGGELAIAATHLVRGSRGLWNLQEKCGDDQIRRLVVAGALIAAEIDRLLLVEGVGNAMDPPAR